MQRPIIVFFGLWITLTLTGTAHAQFITQLSTPNITFRGIGIADSTHSMVVGDSASIYTSTGPDTMRIWHAVPAPCDKSHTFNGVSYYDTNRAAIVTDEGLIFTTTDAGAHWAQSGAGITGQTLRAITHTSNGSLIVVGDSGILLRSIDSGVTWSKIGLGATYNINAISINNSRGYFAGAHGLIGETTDHGASWVIVSDTITNLGANREPITFRSVAISPSDNEGMAVGDSGGMAQTTNGAAWHALDPTGYGYFGVDSSVFEPILAKTCFRTVIYDDPTEGQQIEWLLGGDIDLYFSAHGDTLVWQVPAVYGDADGGEDYAIVRSYCQAAWRGPTRTMIQYGGEFADIETTTFPGYIGWPGFFSSPGLTIPEINFLYISIDSLGKGFASTAAGGIVKTVDNGLTWSISQNIYESGYAFSTAIYTIDSNNAFAVGWTGSLLRTSDGGTTWDSTSIAAANLERLHSIAHPANNVYVVCGDFGTMLRSTDAALTWTSSNTPTTEYLEAVAFSSPDTGIAVGQNGTIIRTADQGITWTNINNPLTGTNVSLLRLQAISSGTYYATTDSDGLWRSTDNGQNWSQVPNASETMGMEFYNTKIGVIAERGWSSLPIDQVNNWSSGSLNPANDSARLAFTRDGFASITEFNIPFMNNNRAVFHFLDSNTFLCLGSDGFVVKVEMSQGGASVTELSSPQTSPLKAFPNPSNTHSITVEYDLDNSESTTIELWNELGQKVETIFEGTEGTGHYSQQLTINPELHGSFFVKVISGTETRALPISVE